TFWRVHHRTVNVPKDMSEESREDVRVRQVSVAFSVDPNRFVRPLTDAPLFAFLPTEERPGFGFLVQTDFLLDASREKVLHFGEWNQWLVGEVAPTFVEAVRAGISDEGFAKTFFQVLPTPDAISDAFFRPTATEIISRLKSESVF